MRAKDLLTVPPKVIVAFGVLLLKGQSFGETSLPPSIREFESLTVERTWPEARPQADPTPVTAKIWNAAIQAALDKRGSVYLPKLAPRII